MAADVSFRIGADVVEIKAALKALGGDVRALRNEFAKKPPGDGLGGINASLKQAKTAVLGLIGAYASFATVASVARLSDEYKQFNAQLKLATKSSDELAFAQSAVFEIAQRNQQGIGATANLYARLSRATADLGVTQGDVAKVTDAVAQAIRVSGASAQEAEASIIQLGQGLASGALRGDELRSVLEQTPRVAQAIADGLNVPIGQLRKLGEEGKLTADAVFGALLGQQAKLAAEGEKIPRTISGSFTVLKNAATIAIGELDAATGASGALVGAVEGIASFLSSGQLQAVFLEVFGTWGATFRAIGEDVGRLIDTIRELGGDAGGGVMAAIGASVGFVLEAFKNLPANVRAFLQILVVEVLATFDKIKAYAKAFKDGIAAVFTDDTVAEVVARTKTEIQSIDEARQDSIEGILAERDALVQAGIAARERYESERKARETAAAAGAGGSGKGKPIQVQPQVIADAFKLAQAEVERGLAALDRAFEAHQLSIGEFIKQRVGLQLDAVDTQIAELQRKLAAADKTEEKSKLLADLQILEDQKLEIARQGIADRAKLEQELNDEILQLRIQQLENEGRTADARRVELEAKYAELIARLKAQGDEAGVEMVNGLINTGVARAKLEELKTQFDATLAEMRAAEQSIEARVKTGEITPEEAELEIQRVRQGSIDQLQQMVDLTRQLAEQTKDPAIQAALRDMETGFRNSTTQISKMQQQVRDNAAGSIEDALYDWATGAKSFEDAVRSAALQFVQSLIRMAAEALAKKAALSLFGAGGLFAGIFHRGGIVGHSNGTRRLVSPLAFAGAPRYHSGGMVGLKSDEVPAVLQRGEEVLSKGDPRNAANGGGGGQGVRIVNVIDPAMAADYLQSGAGERVILNLLQRNSGAVKQILT